MTSCPLYQLTCIAATLSNVSHSKVFSPAKNPYICKIRFAVWLVLYEAGDWSLHRIRDAAGYDAHGSILNGIRRAKALRETSPKFRDFTNALTRIHNTPATQQNNDNA